MAARENPGCFQLKKSIKVGDARPPPPRPLPGTHGLGAHQPPERREQEGAVQSRRGARGGAPGSGQPRHAEQRPGTAPARPLRGRGAGGSGAAGPSPAVPPPRHPRPCGGASALRSRCVPVSPGRGDKGQGQPPLPACWRCSAWSSPGHREPSAAVSCTVPTGDLWWSPAHPGAWRCSSAGAGHLLVKFWNNLGWTRS